MLDLKNRFKNDKLFIALILIQTIPVIFEINEWPLTNYPMFSIVRKPFNQIQRLELFAETDSKSKDLKISPFNVKSFYALQRYINDVNNPRVNEMINEKIEYLKGIGDKSIKKISLNKKIFNVIPSLQNPNVLNLEIEHIHVKNYIIE